MGRAAGERFISGGGAGGGGGDMLGLEGLELVGFGSFAATGAVADFGTVENPNGIITGCIRDSSDTWRYYVQTSIAVSLEAGGLIPGYRAIAVATGPDVGGAANPYVCNTGGGRWDPPGISVNGGEFYVSTWRITASTAAPVGFNVWLYKQADV